MNLVAIIIGLALIGAGISVAIAEKKSVGASAVTRWKALAEQYGASYNIPSWTILAVVEQESSGIPSARGLLDEVGLMQMRPTALIDANRKLGTTYTVEQLVDPEIAIKTGTAYLAWLRDSYHLTLYDALRAYNAGIGRVRQSATAGMQYAEEVTRKERSYV